ncbi:hypothetical protein GCM10010191_87960 [Actinomadura vinacea]|uniref:Secreted protein n=2 Tax=Actinomadura vinacea TaxID=115336 RepID=A0ABN3KFD9_9ACTN
MSLIVFIAFVLLAGLGGTTGAPDGPGGVLRSVDDGRGRGQDDGRGQEDPGRTTRPAELPSEIRDGVRQVGRCRFVWQRKPGGMLRCAPTPERP